VASIWLGYHQETSSVPTNSLHELYVAHYQIKITITNTTHHKIENLYGTTNKMNWPVAPTNSKERTNNSGVQELIYIINCLAVQL